LLVSFPIIKSHNETREKKNTQYREFGRPHARAYKTGCLQSTEREATASRELLINKSKIEMKESWLRE
jgi:hypothetical protein